MNHKFERLRALVLDDDPVYRHIVTSSLNRIGIKETSVAGDLNIAQGKLEREKFDIVTIDVVLKQGSGLDLLKWVKSNQPNLISILVTAGSNAHATREVDALLLGASSLVLKPGGADAASKLDKSFHDIIEGILNDRESHAHPASPVVANSALNGLFPEYRELIAVGASTGGPAIVHQFLSSLPSGYETPIVITQHMPTLHIDHFAKLLNDRTGHTVTVARDGERIEPGRVYVAPGGLHLVLKREGNSLIMHHDNGPEEHNCKPAVDPMFRSIAKACGSRCVGIVMTGMGSDGALGAVELRAKGAPVVVQDKASSVVWGMPGAVVQKNAASVVVPGSQLASWVTRLDLSCTNITKASGVHK
jgi:two-component system chemotaxis response regulator CheB